MSTKLNQVFAKWPAGTVALQRRLSAQGVNHDLTRQYVRSGWLVPIGHGAYLKAGDDVEWQGALFALQTQAHMRVWPGGLTALSMQGFALYLPVARETVWLFGDPGVRLPKWFRQNDWGVDIRFLAPHLFDDTRFDSSSGKFRGVTIEVSSTERAIFELLYQVPRTFSFTFAAETLEGLRHLRPGLMQTYLEHCRFVRVKRLLLFLGDYYRHPWAARIDQTRINLGSGKRQIVKGGRLNSQYQITVPADFTDGSR